MTDPGKFHLLPTGLMAQTNHSFLGSLQLRFLPAAVSLHLSGFVERGLGWDGASPVVGLGAARFNEVTAPAIVSLCLLLCVQLNFFSINLTQSHLTSS